MAGDAGLHSAWHPTLNYFFDFTAAEFGLLNPFFFVGLIWAAIAFWKWRRQNPLHLFLFCMGMPVFLGHWLFSFHSRILPNWIAVSILPMFCLMVAYGSQHRRAAKIFLKGGLAVGLVMALFLHDTDLVGKLHSPLPGETDPAHRVRAWEPTAALVEAQRELLATNGAPAFIIADHYGMTGVLSFYLPAAAEGIGSRPLVYCVDSAEPVNQFYFWPDYDYRAQRQGENAIFVSLVNGESLQPGWFGHWLRREPITRLPAPASAIPTRMAAEFSRVTDLGVRDVLLKDRVFHRVHLWACYNLH